MERLTPKIREIIDEFSQIYIEDPNTIAILLVGSYANSVPHENSDLDIYIIQQEGEDRERGNTWKWDVEIEYFINPIKQVYDYFKNEPIKRPITAHMLSTSIVWFVNNKYKIDFDELMVEARRLMDTPRPPLSEIEIELAKYSFDDLAKDIKDLKGSENLFSYNLVASSIISICVEFLFSLKREKIVKSKLMNSKIKEMDEYFFDLLNNVFESNSNADKILELLSYCENLVGGARNPEWSLRGPCTFD